MVSYSLIEGVFSLIQWRTQMHCMGALKVVPTLIPIFSNFKILRKLEGVLQVSGQEASIMLMLLTLRLNF